MKVCVKKKKKQKSSRFIMLKKMNYLGVLDTGEQ